MQAMLVDFSGQDDDARRAISSWLGDSGWTVTEPPAGAKGMAVAYRSDLGERSGLPNGPTVASLLPTGDLTSIITALGAPAATMPATAAPPASSNATAPNATAPKKDAAISAAPAAASVGGPLPIGLAATEISADVWSHLGKTQAAHIAELVANDQREARRAFANEVTRSVAPEQYLFGHVAASRLSNLAEDILRQREGVSEELTHAGKARAELLDKVVTMSDEVLQQARRWRALSLVGTAALMLTTAFAAVLVCVILGKIGHGVNGYSAAVLVFSLAVFAASPAVLLLNERPLKGVDSWSPNVAEPAAAPAAAAAAKPASPAAATK
ncbi:MAG: hypothetical protein ACR2KJ_18790 [Jatrophihabitans sp.]